MKRLFFITIVLLCLNLVYAYDMYINDELTGQRNDGSRIVDIYYWLSFLGPYDSLGINVQVTTTSAETLICSSFSDSSDIGTVGGPGLKKIEWLFYEDYPEREFYSDSIIITLFSNISSTNPLECTNLKDISAGELHTLVLYYDGTVWGCGFNFNGMIGDGTSMNRRILTQVVGIDSIGHLDSVKNVYAGEFHSMALFENGKVAAWGKNDMGQLGDLTNTDRRFPGYVVSLDSSSHLSNITQLAIGSFHSLALLEDSTIVAWGNNTYGQLGDSTNINRNCPVFVVSSDGTGKLERVVGISSGDNFSSALVYSPEDDNFHVYCWGKNDFGQLGNSTYDSSNRPVQVVGYGFSPFLSDIKKISSEWDHTMALLDDGRVCCWGRNNYSQLGDSMISSRNYPVLVKNPYGDGDLMNIIDIEAGGGNSFVVDNEYKLLGWGRNVSGQLGIDTDDDIRVPSHTLVSTGAYPIGRIGKISAGGFHTIIMQKSGVAFSAGSNNFGQLGDGTTEQRNLPVTIIFPWDD